MINGSLVEACVNKIEEAQFFGITELYLRLSLKPFSALAWLESKKETLLLVKVSQIR